MVEFVNGSVLLISGEMLVIGVVMIRLCFVFFFFCWFCLLVFLLVWFRCKVFSGLMIVLLWFVLWLWVKFSY